MGLTAEKTTSLTTCYQSRCGLWSTDTISKWVIDISEKKPSTSSQQELGSPRASSGPQHFCSFRNTPKVGTGTEKDILSILSCRWLLCTYFWQVSAGVWGLFLVQSAFAPAAFGTALYQLPLIILLAILSNISSLHSEAEKRQIGFRKPKVGLFQAGEHFDSMKENNEWYKLQQK